MVMRVSLVGFDRPGEGAHPLLAHVDVMGERMADDLGLFVNFLGHEVAIIAFFDQQAARLAAHLAAGDDLACRVVEHRAFARQHDPVALFEIGNEIGERGERQRVRAEIHFAVAIADRQRRALARADQQIVFAVKEIGERVGAAHARQRGGDRFNRALAAGEFVGDQKGGDLAVGFGFELMTFRAKFFA